MLVSSLSALVYVNYKNNVDSASVVRVACVGDSITEGSGYPAELQAKLGTRYEVGNFGVSGSAVTLDSGKPYMNQTAFQLSKAFQPDIVIIMLGTNDAREDNYVHIENFTDNYRRLVVEFQALRSEPQVWLVQPPPIYENDLNLLDSNLVQGVIPRIEQVAGELNLPTIDMHEVLASYPEYFGDGVHPSSEGALLIAGEINEAITSAEGSGYSDAGNP